MKKEKKSPRYDAAAAVGALRFDEVLALIHEGRFRDECSDALKACVAHIMSKGGKPSMTLKITFGGQDESGLQMLADVKTSLPAKIRSPQFIYARKGGDVFEYDPDEVELELAMTPATEEEGPSNVTEMRGARKA